jgi:hypothetical protein
MQDELHLHADAACDDATAKVPYQAPQLVVLDQIADKTASAIPGAPETALSVS